jgi:hypothetical protein
MSEKCPKNVRKNVRQNCATKMSYIIWITKAWDVSFLRKSFRKGGTLEVLGDEKTS